MEKHGLAFFDQIRADLAAEGITIRASDWLLEADDAPPDLCLPQTFSRAPHAEWAMVGFRRNRCRWGPQAGSSDTGHVHHVCAHTQRQCKVENNG
jgi:hypothetical protein